MLSALNPYQIIVASLLLAWLIPLIIIWVRFEKLPHANQMLISVLIWPCLLTDEFLRAFGLSQDLIFMGGIFQFTATMIVALIYLSFVT
jgi:hypothetical protein